jgi:hypothetical protein
MASDSVTASVEESSIEKFLLKEKVKQAKILFKLSAQCEEEAMLCASVYD